MYTGLLVATKGKENGMDVKECTIPIMQQPYRADPKSGEGVQEHVQTALGAGIIEPAHTDWAHPVLLEPKRTEPCGYVYISEV